MPPPDEAIDRLYQLPLEEFTAARTALARTVGKADAGSIKGLQKPNVAAWSLNQLYWSARPVFDRLATAAAAMRSAQADVLLGRPADLRTADADHRAALQEALDATASLLEGAGHPVTPDTIRTLTAALEALPWKDRPGRLVRPPAGTGFEALAGLPFASPGTGRPASRAAVVPRPAEAAPPKATPPGEGASGRRPAAAREREEREQRARERQQEKDREKAKRERQAAARKAAERAAGIVRASAERLERLRAAEQAARERLEEATRAVREAEREHAEAIGAEQTAQRALFES